MNDNNLIKAIQERQRIENLNLTEMADKLGVSVSYLSMVYSGKREPATKLLSGVVRCYPELTNQVAIFLLRDITGSQEHLTASGDGDHA